MKCVRGYEVEPQSSAAGYFMGTVDEDGFPNCRISTNYAKTREEALKLPLTRQDAEECKFCNGGHGCFVNSNEAKAARDTSIEYKGIDDLIDIMGRKRDQSK